MFNREDREKYREILGSFVLVQAAYKVPVQKNITFGVLFKAFGDRLMSLNVSS